MGGNGSYIPPATMEVEPSPLLRGIVEHVSGAEHIVGDVNMGEGTCEKLGNGGERYVRERILGTKGEWYD